MKTSFTLIAASVLVAAVTATAWAAGSASQPQDPGCKLVPAAEHSISDTSLQRVFNATSIPMVRLTVQNEITALDLYTQNYGVTWDQVVVAADNVRAACGES
jgi:hypothetical protein